MKKVPKHGWFLFNVLLLASAAFSLFTFKSQNLFASPQSAIRFPEIPLPSFPDRQFNIVDYGAIGDGKAMNTDAIAKTISACATAGGGKVVIPAGIWLTAPIQLA